MSPQVDYLCRMYLAEIKLTNFRNYTYQAVVFSPKLNLVSGLNGMGKTNLLDSVYYLSMGKSHLSGTDRPVVRQGDDFFRLDGKFCLDDGKSAQVVAKVVPGKQKTFEKNGAAYDRISDHVGHFPIVFLAPDDTALALEGSEERRRFLDNTLCQLDRQYLEELMVYNRVLERRNALLRQFAERHNFSQELLEALDFQLLAPANYIHARRAAFMSGFEEAFNQYYQAICGGKEKVTCTYRSQLTDSPLEPLLAETLAKDRALVRTTAGIHKDELVFHLNELPLKRFASQGQLKSFVLAMKLAQYDCLRNGKGIQPILLLDDLFDKLDDSRVAQLIGLLVKGGFGQVFISDTHPERSKALAQQSGGEYAHFTVEEGAVSAS